MKIIGISGRKQSGKNTIANYINGDILLKNSMISDFYIDELGKLIINTTNSSGESGFGEFDVTRKDSEFIEYAERELWPYVKVYHFADPLKEMSINLFGLNPQEVYGDDNQKNMKTHIKWESMPDNINNKTGNMTNREFLEYFGTNIVRKIKTDAWSEFTIKRILAQKSEIAIIPDVRFPNEVDVIKKNGGIIIRLTRNVFDSNADAETALDNDRFNWDIFDVVIDNQDMSLAELCDYLKNNYFLWRN